LLGSRFRAFALFFPNFLAHFEEQNTQLHLLSAAWNLRSTGIAALQFGHVVISLETASSRTIFCDSSA
jgi:hypothetical protein